MTATLLKPGRLSPDQHVPDLGQDTVRPAEHIRSGEAKEPDARHQKAILAPVVLDEADTMRLAVVLDSQPMLGVVEVRTPNKPAFLVPDDDLHPGSGQSVQHEQHPEAG